MLLGKTFLYDIIIIIAKTKLKLANVIGKAREGTAL
jgi:hypothetical protein